MLQIRQNYEGFELQHKKIRYSRAQIIKIFIARTGVKKLTNNDTEYCPLLATGYTLANLNNSNLPIAQTHPLDFCAKHCPKLVAANADSCTMFHRLLMPTGNER